MILRMMMTMMAMMVMISMVTSSHFFCSPHLLPSSSTSLSRQLSSAFKLSSSQSLLTRQVAAYPLFFRVLRFSLIFLTSSFVNPKVNMLIWGSSTSIAIFRRSPQPPAGLISGHGPQVIYCPSDFILLTSLPQTHFPCYGNSKLPLQFIPKNVYQLVTERISPLLLERP